MEDKTLPSGSAPERRDETPRGSPPAPHDGMRSLPIPSAGGGGEAGEPETLEAERIPRAEGAATDARGGARAGRGLASMGARTTCYAVALCADALQWVMFPLFMAGALSPANDVLDLVVAAVLIRLLGWHWAFLPSFAAELIPGLDLVPTWTAAVWLATRKPR